MPSSYYNMKKGVKNKYILLGIIILMGYTIPRQGTFSHPIRLNIHLITGFLPIRLIRLLPLLVHFFLIPGYSIPCLGYYHFLLLLPYIHFTRDLDNIAVPGIT